MLVRGGLLQCPLSAVAIKNQADRQDGGRSRAISLISEDGGKNWRMAEKSLLLLGFLYASDSNQLLILNSKLCISEIFLILPGVILKRTCISH